MLDRGQAHFIFRNVTKSFSFFRSQIRLHNFIRSVHTLTNTFVVHSLPFNSVWTLCNTANATIRAEHLCIYISIHFVLLASVCFYIQFIKKNNAKRNKTRRLREEEQKKVHKRDESHEWTEHFCVSVSVYVQI